MLQLPYDFHSHYSSCITDGSDEIFHIAAWEILFYRIPVPLRITQHCSCREMKVINGTASIRTRTKVHLFRVWCPLKKWAQLVSFLPAPFISIYRQNKGEAVTFKAFSLFHMTCLITKGQRGTAVVQ